MRCLITGGAGFIGSHLSEELLKRGWQVEVVDNLSTSRASNIKELLKNPDFKFYKGSESGKAEPESGTSSKVPPLAPVTL